MGMYNYNRELIKETAKEIKSHGFRVFIAERGTYGFYTDAEGSRVVSFEADLCGLRFSGNYQSQTCGTGWGLKSPPSLSKSDLDRTLFSTAPLWATQGERVSYTTLEKKLAIYQSSSKYKELEQ